MVIRVGDTVTQGISAEGLGASRGLEERAPIGDPDVVRGPTFGDVLGEVVAQASEAERIAGTKAELLARGLSDDLHGTMIAAKEAEISMKLVGSIRNKVLDAFQELWRTNV